MNEDQPVIAATVMDTTAPCVDAARQILKAAGYEVQVFHANGTGGQTMEKLIREGRFVGVLDITTHELAGGIHNAGPDRLTAAAIAGIPQVISVGALDMANHGSPKRTTPEENDRLGKDIAERACAARGPTCVMLPLKGVSAMDAPTQPFWQPEADAALFQSIRNWIYPPELLVEVDAHINDPAFAAAVAGKLLEMLGK